MRQALSLALLLAVPVSTFAAGFEAARMGARSGFYKVLTAPMSAAGDLEVPVPEAGVEPEEFDASKVKFPPKEDFLLDPIARDVQSVEPLTREAGRMDRVRQLDRHRPLVKMNLGGKDYLVSVAVDAAFKNYYASFWLDADRDHLEYFPIENPGDLRGKGIVVTLKDGTQYLFKLHVNIFDIWGKSTIRITPHGSTRGKSYSIKLGTLLSLIKSRSFVFTAGGREFWTLYGTDVDPETRTPARTKSLLFFHFAKMDSKAWTLADAKLEGGEPVALDLGGVRVTAQVTPELEMVISE